MNAQRKVVITLPAYRAERTLEQTVAEIPPGVHEELILVDDASPDNTADLARSLGIQVHVHPKNRGYGGNQKTCYSLALERDADIVVLLHPDYQYEPKAVPLLIAPILAGDADMTFGSRFAGMGDPIAGGMPIYRYVGNRLTTVVQNLILGTRFTEMHSGMRAYTRECLLSLPFLSYPDDFRFDARFLIDAVSGGQRVVEVPIPTRYTKESSSISVSASLKYVWGGVSHAFRQAATRGRRGHRRPVSVIDGASPLKTLQWMVSAADAYVIHQRRAALIGEVPSKLAHEISKADWQIVDGDAYVAFVVASSNFLRDLSVGLKHLNPEGLLVADTSPSGGSYAISELDALVNRAGGRTVEFAATTRHDAHANRSALVVARLAGKPPVGRTEIASSL